jgi:hypothetical protein
MMEFFREGGWGMWPILIFGAVTVGAAVRFMQKPETGLLRFVAAMALTTLITTIHATWTCLAAVASFVEDPNRVADAEMTRTFFAGFKESTRPGTLGGLLLTLACLLVAIGMLRLRNKEKAASS